MMMVMMICIGHMMINILCILPLSLSSSNIDISSSKGYHSQSSTFLPTYLPIYLPTYLPTFVASPSSLHHPYDQMPYHNCRFIHTNDAKRRHINIPLLTGFSLHRGLHVANGIHSLHWRLLEGGIADRYMYEYLCVIEWRYTAKLCQSSCMHLVCLNICMYIDVCILMYVLKK